MIAAKFYAESLGIPGDLANRVAGFMAIANSSPTILSARTWVKDGMVRIYFEPWSQNKRLVFHLADKWYFDARENDVFCTGRAYGTTHLYRLHEIVRLSAGNFAGAKTKASIKEFSEVFYEQKATWD